MFDTLPPFVLTINQAFQNAGFEMHLVGGCVRDLLLKRTVKDWDFTTNAKPEEMLKLFPDGFYDNAFGTVGIPIKENDETIAVVEVTTYRTESAYSDKRRPDIVAWGQSIEKDLQRRDFTINAIAVKIVNNNLKARNPAQPETKQSYEIAAPERARDDKIKYEIIDPYNGQVDLQNKLIRAVGDPKLRFKEDALRLMRAIRLTTQLGFSIDEQTLSELINDASLLENIAKERVRDELMKIIASEFPYDGIMLLRNTNLLQYILPELLEGVGISQERPGRHHKTDVFTHNVMSLKLCPATDPVVRFAALIHDIAKPQVAGKDEDGYVIFHNHELVGSRMADEICDRLRFSKKDKQKISMLVRWHMFTVDEHTTDASIRRFIRRVGVENVKDMIDLRIGDRLGSGTQTAESWRLKLFKKRIEEQLAPLPFSINDLAIDGNDIMQILGIKPSRQVGIFLQKLFEEVDEDLSKNTKEYLKKRILVLAKHE